MVKYVVPADNKEKTMVALKLEGVKTTLCGMNYKIDSPSPIEALAGFEEPEAVEEPEADPLDEIIKGKGGRGSNKGRGKK